TFNIAKLTNKFDKCKALLRTYNLVLRDTKRAAWREHCEEIEGTHESSRLWKILKKDQTVTLGTIAKGDGDYTSNECETLEHLVKTHFPGSTVTTTGNRHPTLQEEIG